MQQACRQCQSAFEITQDDLAFYEKVSPVVAGKKFQIPPPDECFDCRQQRRLLICNEFTLYNDQCSLCGKNVISEFHPGHSFPIFCRPCYLSDRWDPLQHGQEVDFTRPFFEQMREVFTKVPNQMLNIDGEIQNSDYIHFAGTSKNSYLIMHADFCEDCYYGYGFKKNRSCVDGYYNLHCELCYDCVDVHKSYGLTCCQDCVNCHSSSFLKDCIGCHNCFLCIGLRQKEYCFGNQQLSKDEYVRRLATIDLGSFSQYQQFKSKRRAMELQHPSKEYHGHNNEHCFGDYLQNCKNVQYSFDCEDVEGAKYCTQLVLGSKDDYDIYQFGTNLQLSYCSSIVGEGAYHILFNYLNYQNCAELTYCTVMDACRDCFGCTNLRNHRFCILNKQYTKDQYEQLVPRVIEHMQSTGEWGQFLPPFLAHCGYNESTASIYYPLTREEALRRNFQWYDGELPEPKAATVIPADKLPDHIRDIPDDVTQCAIRCEASGKLFKITAQELKFYREHHLPLPRRSWFQRHLDRFHQRNPRCFWSRNCAKCGRDIQTTYAPDRPEIVFCEKCYLKEVY